jgi:hypothetical protein
VNKPFTDIDSKALEALITRVNEAKENNLALSSEDCQLLLNALITLVSMQSSLTNHDVTVHKLRKLLGIEKSSERLSQLLKSKKPPKTKRNKNKTSDEDAFTPVKPDVVIHPLEAVSKGDLCGECQSGKMYKTDPGSFVHITGHSPFTPEQHVMERVRCNACGAYMAAQLPDEVINDGQCSIQKLLGVKIGASTVFDQVELVCNDIYPVYQALFNLASNSEH